MDWLFSWIDKIIQAHIWHALFGGFSWADWLTVVFVIIGLAYGLKQGFFRCFAVTLETCLVIWLVFTWEKKFGTIIAQNLSFLKESQARPLAYILLLSVSGVLMMLIDGKLKNLFHTKLAGPLRVIGGAVMGVTMLLLFLSLITHAFFLLPVQALRRPYNEGGSKTGQFVEKAAPTVYRLMTHPFAKAEKK